MAHPLSKDIEGVTGHNAKLKRMTRDYGAANKSQYKTARGNLENGPQKDYGYGAEGEGEASPARSDRTRRSSAANPIATYKRGGRVAERDKAEARAEGGAVPARAFGGGVIQRARGGKAGRAKAPTNITIVVAPQSPQGSNNPALPPEGTSPVPPPMPKPPMAGPGGPGGPPGGAPGGPPGMPLPPGALPPGGVPPGLMAGLGRKRGGGVHSDAKEDAAQIKRMVKPAALRARGGRLTAGAATGEGRLEKAAMRAKRKGGDKTVEI